MDNTDLDQAFRQFLDQYGFELYTAFLWLSVAVILWILIRQKPRARAPQPLVVVIHHHHQGPPQLSTDAQRQPPVLHPDRN